jgi:hypothetical protein
MKEMGQNLIGEINIARRETQALQIISITI